MSYFDTIYADTLLPHRAIPVYMYLKDRSGSTGKKSIQKRKATNDREAPF